MSPQRLQESKYRPILSLPERIEELQKRNSSLNYEVAHYRDLDQARVKFKKKVARALGILQEAQRELETTEEELRKERFEMKRGA